MRSGLSIKASGTIVILAAVAVGLAGGALWVQSSYKWAAHLERAAIAGRQSYHALQNGTPDPRGIVLRRLDPQYADHADHARFGLIADTPKSHRVTAVSIRKGLPDTSDDLMKLIILSSDLFYPISDLDNNDTTRPSEDLGNIARMLATYCSDATVLARNAGGAWFDVDGTDVWGCAAAPLDLRLPAVGIGLLILAGLLSWIGDLSQRFARFAAALRDRRRTGGPDSYSESGPAELREIVGAVNAHLEAERTQLMHRATVLSGVSHDLGTPATRLRLRAALIDDPDLRDRLNADIDRMTEMIESVLTYTRSEMSAEDPRRMSLAAMVETIVADYQDVGRPVSLLPPDTEPATGSRSVFMSKRGRHAPPETRRVLVTARAVSLSRAIQNLIENALKYGQTARVGLHATSQQASVTVEDDGGLRDVGAIARLIAPFRRGDEAGGGFGLGLTIASTVAEQHGGTLEFEQGARGLLVRLTIPRA